MIDATLTGVDIVAATRPDRRRAGRIEVDAVLLPLLRNPSMAGLLIEHDERDIPETSRALAPRDAVAFPPLAIDDLCPARGILVGLGASIAIWGALYAVAKMLWHLA